MRNVIRVVALLIAVFLVFVRTRPDTYHVERSITVNAPPATVYAQIVDFHAWDAWSPWAKLDPSMKATYDGPASGKGAHYAWAGSGKVGEGNMTITDVRPNEEVAIRLEFIKPFADVCTTGFLLTPEGSGTKVLWTMDGKMQFISKIMCLFKSMDSMIGADYEKGLTQLKKVAEALPPPSTGIPVDSVSTATPTAGGGAGKTAGK